jgi:ribonuclease G
VNRVLALSVAPGEIRGVLLEEGQAVELRLERVAGSSLVDAVFFGRVQRFVPSLPGAFLDLGLGRPALLPGETPRVEGAALLVKVVKDGFADKGPEVTASPDFEGRLAVWTPFRPGIAVSNRIEPAERARLSAVLAKLVDEGEGIVLRSRAAGADADEIAADIDRLRRHYASLLQAATKSTAPGRLDRAEDALGRIAGKIGDEIDRVVIDDRASFARLRGALAAPERLVLDLESGFAERRGLAEAFDQALASHLPLPGGGEIVIEDTVAFTAVDVNLSAAAGKRGRAATAILAVNRAAAVEIGRQLRLRNIGGAIVMDFVSMSSREHRRAVEAALAEAVLRDPMPVELHGWTRLGHLELTRKRGAPSIPDRMLGAGGARRAKTPTTVALELLRALTATAFRPGRVEIRLHPGIAAELQGALAPAYQAAIARAGRPVVLAVEPGRDPETFDIAGT